MKNSLRNEKGALTIDFLFALVMVMGTTVVFGMFCFTLSLVEVIQYTAFSTSRGYFAGHVDRDKQLDLAQGIYNELIEGKFKFFFGRKKGWFEITPKDPNAIWNNHGSTYSSGDPRDVFEGTRFNVHAKILGMSIPFLGDTQRNGAYKASVTSFLGREVTSAECMQTINRRYDIIQTLDPGYNDNNLGDSNTKYYGFDDNGC